MPTAHRFALTSLLIAGAASAAFIPDNKVSDTKPPVVVQSLSGGESIKATDEHETAVATERLVWVTGVLALFTFLLWVSNRRLINDAAETSRQQNENTRASIAEAARSADAMLDVARATKANAELMEGILHKQMRAYVSVDLGETVYQDDNLKFASSPRITNTGFTPAKNLRYVIKAAILDMPLRDDFDFTSAGRLSTHDATLSPRQTFIVSGVVDQRFNDVDREAILLAQAKRLFVWGTVAYEDVFGGSFITNFCHNFNFYGKDDKGNYQAGRFYYGRHNNST